MFGRCPGFPSAIARRGQDPPFGGGSTLEVWQPSSLPSTRSSSTSWSRRRGIQARRRRRCSSTLSRSPRAPTRARSGAPESRSSSIRSRSRAILAELHLDEETLAAALLHDVVEDTERRDRADVRAEFGDEVAKLVDGVTKLTRIQFQSREHAEAENYRKMIVAMAQDPRVILIKLADRLHNMRTIEYLGKQKQIQKAKEALEVYAPIAHRLGIHAMKWELEDLAFETLHPRKYAEISAMVAERRGDREEHVKKAASVLGRELEKADIPADISGRPKHFYSIYDKMVRKGREFNEIYDLTAMRVIVRARRGGGHPRLLRRARAHPLALEADARPVQGLRGDAQAEPLPGAAHDRGRARGQAARDPDPHARDAPRGRVRNRRALDLQARPQGQGRRGVDEVGAAGDGLAGRRGRPARVHQDLPHRPLRRRGLCVHAQGRGEDAARRARRRSTSPTPCTRTSATGWRARR